MSVEIYIYTDDAHYFRIYRGIIDILVGGSLRSSGDLLLLLCGSAMHHTSACAMRDTFIGEDILGGWRRSSVRHVGLGANASFQLHKGLEKQVYGCKTSVDNVG